MHFQVRVPKISGDVVALCSVVDAMAMAKATAFGATEFHEPMFDGSHASIIESLLNEAKTGRLQVCNSHGFVATADELIARAKRVGTFCVHSRYVVKPDWDALKKEHPKAELPNGAWDFRGVDLGETIVDEDSSDLHCLYATLKHLNDWGASAGNSFSLDPNALPWIDERGVMGIMKETEVENSDGSTKAGDTAVTDGSKQMEGEPPMQVGSNPARAYKSWIEWQARMLTKGDSDTLSNLAGRIIVLATERNYRNTNGDPFTNSSVARLLTDLVPGITGTRSKNGKKTAEIDLACRIKVTPNPSTESTHGRKPSRKGASRGTH